MEVLTQARSGGQAPPTPHPGRTDWTAAGRGLMSTAGVDAADIVDVWGAGSFPASDPPASW
ncbi:hypothetical protein [Georgenia yuyongxinii]